MRSHSTPFPLSVFRAGWVCIVCGQGYCCTVQKRLDETLTLGQIGAARCASFCDYSDELVMLVGFTGIVEAGAGVGGRLLDIITGDERFDIPECHSEVAALLAAGSI